MKSADKNKTARKSSRKPKLKEEEIAESFREVIVKDRKRIKGEKREISPKEKDQRMFMWIIIALIMVSLIALWVFSFKYSISRGKSEAKNDQTAQMWNEIKKNIDQFGENFNTIFSQMNLEQLKQANQNTALGEEEIKKLTNEVLEKIKQGQANTNINLNINANTNTGN
jgi:hypothetical protein